MQQEVYRKGEEPEKVRRWALEPQPSGDIAVVLIDVNGRRDPNGRVVCLTKDGTFCLYYKVTEEYGLKLDDNGHIKEDVWRKRRE